MRTPKYKPPFQCILQQQQRLEKLGWHNENPKKTSFVKLLDLGAIAARFSGALTDGLEGRGRGVQSGGITSITSHVVVGIHVIQGQSFFGCSRGSRRCLPSHGPCRSLKVEHKLMKKPSTQKSLPLKPKGLGKKQKLKQRSSQGRKKDTNLGHGVFSQFLGAGPQLLATDARVEGDGGSLLEKKQ